MKEFLFQVNKRIKANLKLYGRIVRRLFVNTKLSKEDTYKIPIVINNRNRYTYLSDFVSWLNKAGYKNIYILDNDSTYPKLLEYYKTTSAKVVYLKKNVGYKALWEIDFFQTIKRGFYVYTDSDLIPIASCPNDFVYQLYLILSKYKIEKCGPALKIDDLPDYYDRKNEVLTQVENKYWQTQIEPDVYDAPIDTTFALYKPFAWGNAEECKAYRVGGNITFIHLPWYENSANLTDEAKFYKENVSSSSYWYTKK